MQKRAGLFEPELGEIVTLEITKPLPGTCSLGFPYSIEGTAKVAGIGAPPWVYAELKLKKWYEPELIEKVSYKRGLPKPVSGDFSIDLKFEEKGNYEVTVVASPAPLSLPVVGVPPVVGKSGMMAVNVTEEAPPDIGFSLAKPTVQPATIQPGTNITISCPVTSQCTQPQNIEVKCIVYEGSALPGHGSQLAEYRSGVVPIQPGQTLSFDFSRTAVAGTIDRRDVEVEVYLLGTLVKESEWDDVYYVGTAPPEETDFLLTKPTVTPAEVYAGSPITITCPVTSACTKEQTITVRCKIYEGSLLPGHGTLIATKTSTAFSTSPGQAYNVNVQHTAVPGTIDRRDVEVEVYIGGTLVKENEWDDVYYVEEAPGYEPPTVTTLSARDVTHDEATLVGRLDDTGWQSYAYCYFEYGLTTPAYGNTTPEQRLQDLGEFSELIGGLTPGTTYHYRAVAYFEMEGVRYADYGSDRTFTTSTEPVLGFTMSNDVFTIPAGATHWWVTVVAASGYGAIDFGMKPIYQVLEYYGDVPTITRDIMISAHDAAGNSKQYDRFPYLLRPGKSYEWNWATHELGEI